MIKMRFEKGEENEKSKSSCWNIDIYVVDGDHSTFCFICSSIGCRRAMTGGTSVYAVEKNPYTGPPIKLRFSQFAPATHMMTKLVGNPWEEMMEKESNGKIKMDRYMGGILRGARDGFKACIADITDLTAVYVLYQPTSFNLMHVLDLPFAFPSSKVASLVGEELAPKYFKKEYEKMDVYLLISMRTGPLISFQKSRSDRLKI